MDAPPPAPPDAGTAAAPISSASASAPSSAAQTSTAPSASTASAPASESHPAPMPTPSPGPAQTLEPPAPSPVTASARPPPPARMRPPYTHLASPITMSSSPATALASSAASVAATSPAMARGSVTMGLPPPRGSQTPSGYTGFVPPPPLARQFYPMHRAPDQPPPSSAQLRQPSPGIQNIGTVGSINTSQVRPGTISGPQQPRPSFPSSTIPSSSGNQMPGSQKTHNLAIPRPLSTGSPSPALQQTPPNAPSPFRPPQQRPQVTQTRPYLAPQSAPTTSHQQNVVSAQQQQQKLPQHQLVQQQQQQKLPQQQLVQQQQQQKLPQQQLVQQQQSQPQHLAQQNQQNASLKNQQPISQQQAARTPVSVTQKLDSPATLPVTNMRPLDMASIDMDSSESGNRLLSKRSIHELVAQIDPSEKLDPEVEDVLIDIAEDFVESVATFACSLAKHRKSSTLEAKDVLLHAERSWNITLPGFSGDEIKLYKKPHVNDIHRERLTLIKKSMASESNTKSSAAQAAANQKNQTPKPPATSSP